jgi:hypothetical protein
VESAVLVADRSRGLEAHRFHVNFYRAILLMEVDRLAEAQEAIRIGRRLSEDLGVKGSLPLVLDTGHGRPATFSISNSA